jgi:segregation and condensation protein B
LNNQSENVETVQFIEALLFLENRPVNIKYISKLSGKSDKEIKNSLIVLQKKLSRMESSLIVTENDKGDYHLTISPLQYNKLFKYYDRRKKTRLSNQALETLAIIAYKQPITRVEIENIRGVQVSHIIRVLLENKLVRFMGKKDSPGKPMLYGTTDNFLKYFGLLNIKDLPPISEFEKT